MKEEGGEQKIKIQKSMIKIKIIPPTAGYHDFAF